MEANFKITNKSVKRGLNDYNLVINIFINDKNVFTRSFFSQTPPICNPTITGKTYKEFLVATGTKSDSEYTYFNATNNAYSQYFGVRGWNYKDEYGILPKVSYKDFL